MKNEFVNDNAYAMVYRGTTKDILCMHIEGCAIAAGYLQGMIYSSESYDFFTKEYSLISLFSL